MNLKRFYTAERYPGESLSSWMFRLKATSSGDWPSVTARAHDLDVDDVDDVGIDNGGYPEKLMTGVDPDFYLRRGEEAYLMQRFGAQHAPWVTDAATSRLLLPLHNRCAYCYECMATAITRTGFPVCLTKWRHVLEPFCDRHPYLLREGNLIGRVPEDLPRYLFKWHWQSQRERNDYELYAAANAPLLALSRQVQLTITQTLMAQSEMATKHKIENFILTLMRALMMPCMNGSYDGGSLTGGRSEAVRRIVGGANYTVLYLQPFLASSATRARALYLVGLVLGWISESAAKAAAGKDFYIATSAEHITRWLLDEQTGLARWLSLNLQRFETDTVSLSVLQSASPGWR